MGCRKAVDYRGDCEAEGVELGGLVGSVYGWVGGKLEWFCVLEERREWAFGRVLYLVLELFKVGEGAD